MRIVTSRDAAGTAFLNALSGRPALVELTVGTVVDDLPRDDLTDSSRSVDHARVGYPG
ncbi:hypothetical protein [Agromyces bracchium]|uniref:Uncharacterized protein n=1 Tax=Agromyces bracchium TaxID=88376 RepID=A0A6I3MFZ9_9MICO|nr:hypothetical protein [Agromyces bracchium]MTH70296.1 hypothetical protein [Agromyces bracchium]